MATEEMNLRFHKQSCNTCRYIRGHKTGCYTTECLHLGRTMSIGDMDFAISATRERVCNGWSKRPKSWDVWQVADMYRADPYISEAAQKRLRRR